MSTCYNRLYDEEAQDTVVITVPSVFFFICLIRLCHIFQLDFFVQQQTSIQLKVSLSQILS